MPKKDVEWAGKCPRVTSYQLVSCCLRCLTFCKSMPCMAAFALSFRTRLAQLLLWQEIYHFAFVVASLQALSFFFKLTHSSNACPPLSTSPSSKPSIFYPKSFYPSTCYLWFHWKRKSIKNQNEILVPLQRSSCSRCVWHFVYCQLLAVSHLTLQPRKVVTSPSTPRSSSAVSPAQRGLQAAQDLLDHLGPWVRWVCRGRTAQTGETGRKEKEETMVLIHWVSLIFSNLPFYED